MHFKKFVPYTLNEELFKKITYDCLPAGDPIATPEVVDFLSLFRKIRSNPNKEISNSIWEQPFGKEILVDDVIYRVRNITGYDMRKLFWLLGILANEGVSFLDCTWYFYESDESMEDPWVCHYFFVTDGIRIVHDAMFLSESFGDDVLPDDLFKHPTYQQRISFNEKRDDHATALVWYKKFYSETNAGRISAMKELIETDKDAAEKAVLQNDLCFQIYRANKNIRLILYLVFAVLMLVLSRK